jgi:hypothetical protein
VNRHDRRHAAVVRRRWSVLRIDVFGANDNNPWCDLARDRWPAIVDCDPQCFACSAEFDGAWPSSWLRIEQPTTAVLAALCGGCEQRRQKDPSGVAEALCVALRQFGSDARLIDAANLHFLGGRA